MPRRLLIAAAALACACGSKPPSRAPAPAEAQPPPSFPAGTPRIVCLGDSLTSGYGLEPSQAWPALLQERLRQKGLAYEVVNAGVSGDTSAGGRQRLEGALQGDVRLLALALGANDGLRGLSLAELKGNLTAIVKAAQARGIPVLLLGMETPPNLGEPYTRDFRQVFHDVAREQRVAGFLPFLLSGVAGDPALNQPDSIHPNALGTRMVAENVWQALEPLLGAAGPRSAAGAR